MKNLQIKLLRLEELETKAMYNFLACSDYKVVNWLDTKEEIKEYKQLLNETIKRKDKL